MRSIVRESREQCVERRWERGILCEAHLDRARSLSVCVVFAFVCEVVKRYRKLLRARYVREGNFGVISLSG